MAYEKKLFINNVYALAAKYGMRIKDLESACGVSIGYFARLRQGKKDGTPGADTLLNVSEQLSVSVDALLTFNFETASESEQLLLNYIEKLIRETQSNSILWQEDPFAYPGSVVSLTHSDGTTPHPLYTTVPVNGAESKPLYHSAFYPLTPDLVPIKVYGSVFPGEKTLYLVQIASITDTLSAAKDAEVWNELELVMTGTGISAPIPLFHTDHECPGQLDGLMWKLFSAVENSLTVPRLTPEALDVIHDFLK